MFGTVSASDEFCQEFVGPECPLPSPQDGSSDPYLQLDESRPHPSTLFLQDPF